MIYHSKDVRGKSSFFWRSSKITLILDPPSNNTSSAKFFPRWTKIITIWRFMVTKTTIIFGFRRWFGLGNGLRHAKMHCFKLRTNCKISPMVKLCLLSNNCWPIFGRIFIGIFGRSKMFSIILKLVFLVSVLSIEGLSTSCNDKGELVS